MTPFGRQAPIKRTLEFLYLFKLLSAQPFPERHRPQCQDTELYSPAWCVPVAIEPLLSFLSADKLKWLWCGVMNEYHMLRDQVRFVIPMI